MYEQLSYHVNTNYTILHDIYGFRVDSDTVFENTRIRVWDCGIVEYMSKINGEWDYHKIGSPAIDSDDNAFVTYFVNGKTYVESKLYCDACGYDEMETMMFILKNGEDLPYF